MPAGEAAASSGGGARAGEYFDDKSEKRKDVRASNIVACKAIADCVRTSLGPRGMDKMIKKPDGEVVITNDGATILQQMKVIHPAGKMMVDLSKAQDVEAGDGTTSVVVLCGAFLTACEQLLSKGIHPTTIADSFQKANRFAQTCLKDIATPLALSDRQALIKACITSLSSKLVFTHSSFLAPLAVDAVLRVIDPESAENVDLNDIKTVKKVGGTIDDTVLVDGLVLSQHSSHAAGGAVNSVRNAKILLIQFCLSPPKTNIEQSIVISDYAAMDRILKQEKKYILDLIRDIKKTGCNVLLIQKSILRDAVNDLALHYLARAKIMVVTDIERDDVEFICKTLNCQPVATPEQLAPGKLGSAELVEEVSTGEEKVVKVTGIANPGKTVSVLVRGSNKLVVDEAERSLHDALCVVRSLVKMRYIISGGGSPEIELALRLADYAKQLTGKESYCVRAFADALEIIPYTLAENAGLHAIAIVTELRNRHASGEVSAGINARTGHISDMNEENVLQPLLVTSNALHMATETVVMILKIDDLVFTR
jgi:T-complex protein 1 subunit delta